MRRKLDLSKAAEQIKRDLHEPLIEAAAIIVRDTIVEVIQSSQPAGKEYRVPGTKTKYTASAPGQPPAVREGRYVASWKSTPSVRSPSGVHAFAYSDLMTEDGRFAIGALLEDGTIHMAPRPHVGPAMPIAADRIERLLSRL
jgi:hypothetical protein